LFFFVLPQLRGAGSVGLVSPSHVDYQYMVTVAGFVLVVFVSVVFCFGSPQFRNVFFYFYFFLFWFFVFCILYLVVVTAVVMLLIVVGLFFWFWRFFLPRLLVRFFAVVVGFVFVDYLVLVLVSVSFACC